MKKIIITILTLALIITTFASCIKVEEPTTTYEPIIEFPTEEITSDEVTTETPTTMQEETTAEVPSTEEVTTEAPTTQTPETTTQAPETTTKAPETTTNEPIKEVASPDFSLKDEPEEDLNFIGGDTVSPERAGLIYDKTGRLSSYDKIPEGSKYYEYDSNGVEHLKTKPYSPGNDPGPDRCKYCDKETKPYDGKHYGCYYGYCDRFMKDMNCPECNEFVPSNTCHTCKK